MKRRYLISGMTVLSVYSGLFKVSCSACLIRQLFESLVQHVSCIWELFEVHLKFEAYVSLLIKFEEGKETASRISMFDCLKL